MICIDLGSFNDSWRAAGELGLLDPRLKPINHRLYQELTRRGRRFILTSVKRAGGSGVHWDLRADDVDNDGLTYEEGKEIEAKINSEFPRNDGRPTCYFHRTEHFEGRPVGPKDGWHFHLQVEPELDLGGDIEENYRGRGQGL